MKELKGKISIIMPAHNEAGHIASSIGEVAKTLRDFACPWELIVMDDGSTDETFSRANEASKKYPEHVIVKRNNANKGKGRAIKKALHYVTGDYVVFLDADMDLPPIQIRTLFDMMFLNDADIVIGSKLHPNSRVSYPRTRRIISFGYYILIRILFNLPCHDTQTGIKLFRAHVLRSVFSKILVRKFAFDLEVLVNANHLRYRIVEAPIILNSQRRYGRIGMQSIFTTLWDTLAVFYRMRVTKYYDRIDYYRRKNMAKEFRKLRR